MNENILKKKWKKEEEKAFKGWDFSYLEDHWQEEELPWSYRDIVLDHLKSSDKLLDMGTGGGEFLLTLNHPYNLTSVTEAYPPNLKLCRKKLSPLGIEVREIVSDSELPYESDKFDVIINRHEAFDVNEVARVLKNKGCFDNLLDLKRELDQNGFICGTEHRFLIAARAKK